MTKEQQQDAMKLIVENPDEAVLIFKKGNEVTTIVHATAVMAMGLIIEAIDEMSLPIQKTIWAYLNLKYGRKS